jgi:hypothetical protein
MPEQVIHSQDTQADGHTDFDRLFGRWNVRHRRLQKRLEGDTRWDEFAGTSETRPMLGGFGNVEDNLIEFPDGTYRAAAVRTFDPATGLWAIWWIDGRNPSVIDVPVRGSFKDGVGTFLCDDVLDGKPIKVRFIWSEITESAARWQQAFSADGGETWETNWDMRFSRAA